MTVTAPGGMSTHTDNEYASNFGHSDMNSASVAQPSQYAEERQEEHRFLKNSLGKNPRDFNTRSQPMIYPIGNSASVYAPAD